MRNEQRTPWGRRRKTGRGVALARRRLHGPHGTGHRRRPGHRQPHAPAGPVHQPQRAGHGENLPDITPEQEYYIGRSVAATVLHTYRPLDNAAANRYLNVIGGVLAQASDRPETFGGYHFQILNSDDVNAFSAPGGFVMVSRGMLRCCRSEDAVAAVLAHEIGHVQGQHGLRAIKKGRLTSALTVLAAEGAKNLGGQDVAELTRAFEGTIGDITSTLMNNGYARGLEREADQTAVTILQRVGYDPAALVAMLAEMKQHLQPGGLDFAKTHPSPDARIAELRGLISAAGPVATNPVRRRRFERAIGSL